MSGRLLLCLLFCRWGEGSTELLHDFSWGPTPDQYSNTGSVTESANDGLPTESTWPLAFGHTGWKGHIPLVHSCSVCGCSGATTAELSSHGDYEARKTYVTYYPTLSLWSRTSVSEFWVQFTFVYLVLYAPISCLLPWFLNIRLRPWSGDRVLNVVSWKRYSLSFLGWNSKEKKMGMSHINDWCVY